MTVPFSCKKKSYLETAANSCECIRDWNLLSSVLKCSLRLELSLSTVQLSIANFSMGDAFIFLYIMPALTSEERVEAVMESEVATSKSNLTPLEKFIVETSRNNRFLKTVVMA